MSKNIDVKKLVLYFDYTSWPVVNNIALFL